jgi:hypothetical protein
MKFIASAVGLLRRLTHRPKMGKRRLPLSVDGPQRRAVAVDRVRKVSCKFAAGPIFYAAALTCNASTDWFQVICQGAEL